MTNLWWEPTFWFSALVIESKLQKRWANDGKFLQLLHLYIGRSRCMDSASWFSNPVRTIFWACVTGSSVRAFGRIRLFPFCAEIRKNSSVCCPQMYLHVWDIIIFYSFTIPHHSSFTDQVARDSSHVCDGDVSPFVFHISFIFAQIHIFFLTFELSF